MNTKHALRQLVPVTTLAIAALAGSASLQAAVIETGPSAYAHTIDGQFTGWPPANPGDAYEWFDITPVKDTHPTLGLLGYVYDDYQSDGWLYKLNDWTISDGALNVTDDNLFIFKTADGLDLWVLTVHSDPGGKSLDCKHNGADCAAGTFFGDYSVVATLNKAELHSVWEIALYIGRVTDLYESRLDPIEPGGPLVGSPGEFVSPLPSGGIRIMQIPEPTTGLLLGSALVALIATRRNSITAHQTATVP